MAKILLALAGCHDAFVAGPVAEALVAAGDELHVAWFGTAAAFEHALALGLPDVDATIAGEVEGDALVAAAEFADDDWFGCDTVLTIGSDPFSLAIAQAAIGRGRRVVRLQAGDRSGHRSRDRARRLADHAATHCCVADETRRMRLRREGLDDRRVAVVGSLTADAAARARGPASAARYLWLAIEHAESLATHGAALAEVARQVATAHGLAVHAVPTHLAGAPWSDPAWFLEDLCDPAGQLRGALGAALIVTDSAGHQQLAAATATPCVVLPDAMDMHCDLDPADVLIPASTLDDVLEMAAVALARGVRRPEATGKASLRVVAALQSFESATDRNDALPSDGDASGRTFDEAERLLVDDVLHRGTLNSTRGVYVTRFEREFAAWLGTKHAIACASGSAAVHCAIAALGLEPGDEVITTPITDMGALTPISYEGAVPVFADVDPDTLNVNAATIEAQLTARTRAIVVTHLFGRPCELDAILALAERRGIPVLEDTAQAFGATWRGRKVGTFGRLAAFSLQQGKHITAGEGGIVCTDDDELARRVFLFVNKAWGYGDPKPDHYFPALNYRMTELQGAVVCAQLPKLECVVAMRRGTARGLRDELASLPGVHCPDDPPHGTHSYWKFALRVDPTIVPGGAVALGGRMRDQGIACVPRYVQKPAFECQLYQEWRRFPVLALPLGHNPRGATDRPLFDRVDYPGAVQGLEQVVVLPINERYATQHVRAVADAIRKAHRELTGG